MIVCFTFWCTARTQGVSLDLLLLRASAVPWFLLTQGCCPGPEKMFLESVVHLFSGEAGKGRIGLLGPAGSLGSGAVSSRLWPSPRFLRASCVLRDSGHQCCYGQEHGPHPREREGGESLCLQSWRLCSGWLQGFLQQGALGPGLCPTGPGRIS